ncbi:hypothetical protein F5Y13DRAFT_188898 [Hypoxylon sp. FL1857]|nr:hypothetical protein F5Y13DRAFT_188898 [Hypoxylon sp. FL1857]
MGTAPIGATIGNLMILCLGNNHEDHDPVVSMFSLALNAAVAICVANFSDWGVLQELHGIALMGACRGSCGTMHPAGHVVAATMLAHKLVTLDGEGFTLEMMAALCVNFVPARVFSLFFRETSQAFLHIILLGFALVRLVLSLPGRVFVLLCHAYATMRRWGPQGRGRPQMVDVGTQTDHPSQPQQLTLSNAMVLADIPPIPSPQPSTPVPTLPEPTQPRRKPRATWLRGGLEPIIELLPEEHVATCSRTYLRELWANKKSLLSTAAEQSPVITEESPAVSEESITIVEDLEEPDTTPNKDPAIPVREPTPVVEATTTIVESITTVEQLYNPTIVSMEEPNTSPKLETAPAEESVAHTEENVTVAEELATEEPTLITEEPTSITEELPVMMEEPTAIMESTPNTEEPPVIMEPTSITEEAPIVTEEPTPNTEEAPIMMQPTPTTEAPPVMMEEPTAITEETPVVTEEPTFITEELPVMTDPTPITEAPPVIMEEPTAIMVPTPNTEEPPVMMQPTPTTEEPPIVTEEPTPNIEEPPSMMELTPITEELPATMEPTPNTEGTPIIPEELTVTTEEPTVVVEEPMAAEATYFTPPEEPVFSKPATPAHTTEQKIQSDEHEDQDNIQTTGEQQAAPIEAAMTPMEETITAAEMPMSVEESTVPMDDDTSITEEPTTIMEEPSAAVEEPKSLLNWSQADADALSAVLDKCYEDLWKSTAATEPFTPMEPTANVDPMGQATPDQEMDGIIPGLPAPEAPMPSDEYPTQQPTYQQQIPNQQPMVDEEMEQGDVPEEMDGIVPGTPIPQAPIPLDEYPTQQSDIVVDQQSTIYQQQIPDQQPTVDEETEVLPDAHDGPNESSTGVSDDVVMGGAGSSLWDHAAEQFLLGQIDLSEVPEISAGEQPILNQQAATVHETDVDMTESSIHTPYTPTPSSLSSLQTVPTLPRFPFSFPIPRREVDTQTPSTTLPLVFRAPEADADMVDSPNILPTSPATPSSVNPSPGPDLSSLPSTPRHDTFMTGVPSTPDPAPETPKSNVGTPDFSSIPKSFLMPCKPKQKYTIVPLKDLASQRSRDFTNKGGKQRADEEAATKQASEEERERYIDNDAYSHNAPSKHQWSEDDDVRLNTMMATMDRIAQRNRILMRWRWAITKIIEKNRKKIIADKKLLRDAKALTRRRQKPPSIFIQKKKKPAPRR